MYATLYTSTTVVGLIVGLTSYIPPGRRKKYFAILFAVSTFGGIVFKTGKKMNAQVIK